MTFLRRVLFLDAATCLAAGLLMLLGAALLSDLLGLPEMLLRYAGLSLLPFAGFLLYLGSREQPPRGGVWLVIALNALWVLDSLVLLTVGGFAPTALGYAFVLVQAAAVALLAELEFIGLRRVQAAFV